MKAMHELLLDVRREQREQRQAMQEQNEVMSRLQAQVRARSSSRSPSVGGPSGSNAVFDTSKDVGSRADASVPSFRLLHAHRPPRLRPRLRQHSVR